MQKDTIEALMFVFGPLHNQRFRIERQLRDLPIQTGDIFYRASDAKGPLGLPFSRLVARVTKSPYSHAAIALVENGEINMLEVNDAGTLKCRLIDWLDTCYTDEFSVFRLKDSTPETVAALEREIKQVLINDPDYDFSFSDEYKFYCTESVATIYKNIGQPLVNPEYLRKIVAPWLYRLVCWGNKLMGCFSCTLPLNVPLYYVGNQQRGMMSSLKTEEIFHFSSRPTS